MHCVSARPKHEISTMQVSLDHVAVAAAAIRQLHCHLSMHHDWQWTFQIPFLTTLSLLSTTNLVTTAKN